MVTPVYRCGEMWGPTRKCVGDCPTRKIAGPVPTRKYAGHCPRVKSCGQQVHINGMHVHAMETEDTCSQDVLWTFVHKRSSRQLSKYKNLQTYRPQKPLRKRIGRLCTEKSQIIKDLSEFLNKTCGNLTYKTIYTLLSTIWIPFNKNWVWNKFTNGLGTGRFGSLFMIFDR